MSCGACSKWNRNSKKAELSTEESRVYTTELWRPFQKDFLIPAVGNTGEKNLQRQEMEPGGVHVCTPSQKVEAGGAEDQGQLWLHSEFQECLGYS